MKLVISDANILIDMDVGGLTEEMFKLPQTLAVFDILFLEELVEQLVIEKVIPLSRANDAYHRMKSGNRRLPWRDVERQLKRLAEAARPQGH